MQSQVREERNFEPAAHEVIGKMKQDPESVTSEVVQSHFLFGGSMDRHYSRDLKSR